MIRHHLEAFRTAPVVAAGPAVDNLADVGGAGVRDQVGERAAGHDGLERDVVGRLGGPHRQRGHVPEDVKA